MSPYKSSETRLEDLTRNLKQRDTELDQYVNDIVDSNVDDIDEAIKSTDKDIREDIRQVEEVKGK